MHPYMYEEVAWQRLQDAQRDMEYSRYLANQGVPALARLAQWVGARVRSLGARPALRSADGLHEDRDPASDAA